MAMNFSLNSFIKGHALVYITPCLIASSLFHIFDSVASRHLFGQLQILGAFCALGYYLWNHLGDVYPSDQLGKKRIEAVVCAVVGTFSMLLLLAPLMTWQFISFYRAAQNRSYLNPIIIAVAIWWIGTSLYLYSTLEYTKAKLAATNPALQQSVMPGTSPSPSSPSEVQ